MSPGAKVRHSEVYRRRRDEMKKEKRKSMTPVKNSMMEKSKTLSEARDARKRKKMEGNVIKAVKT